MTGSGAGFGAFPFDMAKRVIAALLMFALTGGMLPAAATTYSDHCAGHGHEGAEVVDHGHHGSTHHHQPAGPAVGAAPDTCPHCPESVCAVMTPCADVTNTGALLMNGGTQNNPTLPLVPSATPTSACSADLPVWTPPPKRLS